MPEHFVGWVPRERYEAWASRYNRSPLKTPYDRSAPHPGRRVVTELGTGFIDFVTMDGDSWVRLDSGRVLLFLGGAAKVIAER